MKIDIETKLAMKKAENDLRETLEVYDTIKKYCKKKGYDVMDFVKEITENTKAYED